MTTHKTVKHIIVCLSVCLSLAAFRNFTHCCTDPDVTWGNGTGCPLVVPYWADLQSVHGFRFCDNIPRTRNVSECLYSLCAWLMLQTPCEWMEHESNDLVKPSHRRHPSLNGCLSFTSDVRTTDLLSLALYTG